MDTVVYKLHNPEAYPVICKAVQDIENGKGLMQIPYDESLHKETKFSKLWFNKKNDAYIIWSHISHTDLPSGASGVNIMFDKQRDYIKFELSVPKFFFANNVIEVIPPLQNKHYNSDHSMKNLCSRYWHQTLKAVFYKIIKDVTKNMFTDFKWSDVEVSRIDITFNQIFETRSDALHYFEVAKKAKVPRLRDGANKDYYDTAVTFLSKGNYYFKCYHKGTEFDKVSKHQITKTYDSYNQKGLIRDGSIIAFAMQHKDELQEHADKILRYELECKNGLMNQLFKAHLHKHKMPEYKKIAKLFDYLMHDRTWHLYRCLRIRYRDHLGNLRSEPPRLGDYTKVYQLPKNLVQKSTDGGYVDIKNEKTINKLKRILKCVDILSRRYGLHTRNDIKKAYKQYRYDLDTSFLFFFEVDEKDTQKATSNYDTILNDVNDIKRNPNKMDTLEQSPKKQRFSVALLQALILKHGQLFSKLQCDELPDFKDAELRAIEYNKTNNKRVNVNKIKMIATMHKNMTWNEIQETGHYDRTTIYRWKRDFEKIMGFDKDINFITDIQLFNVPRLPSNIYYKHYQLMILPKSIISLFIQQSSVLLSI